MSESPISSVSPITHLRHVDIAVQDYEKQVAFYEEKWGLVKAGSDGDVTYFAAEGSPEQYVIRVRRAQDKRLDLVSYGAADRETVDALAVRLARGGVRLVGEPDELQTPGVVTVSGSSMWRAARSRCRRRWRRAGIGGSRSVRTFRCGCRMWC